MAAGGRLPLTPGARLRMLVGRGDRLARAGAAARGELVERLVDGDAVARRRGQHARLAAERHDADVDRLGHLRHEALGGGAGGDQARRAHVGGLHRAADVGDEHDRRALDRHRDGLLRARGGEDQDRQREQEGEHRHVQAPARAVRRHRRGHARAPRRRPRRGGGRAGARRRARRAPGCASRQDQHQGRGEAHGEDAHGESCAGRLLQRRVEAHVLAGAVDADVEVIAGLLGVDDARDVVGGARRPGRRAR